MVAELEAMLQYFGGTDNKVYQKPGQIGIVTNEGPAAVQEAIDFLKTATATTAIEWDQMLMFASRDMAVAQGATTQTGHTSPDGSSMSDRLAKYG